MADAMINAIPTVTMHFAGVTLNKPLKFVSLYIIFVLILLPSNRGTAEVLRDPTRPPNVHSIVRDKETEIVRRGPQLQAVIISENRRSAIISNRSVNMGDTIDGAQIIRINESEVVLKTGDRLQILKLYPNSSRRTIPSDRHATR